jgi:hypothetical protein
MDLLDVRTWFVQQSGRYDLVVDAVGGNWTDAGANRIINAAQRMLDRMGDKDKQLGTNFQLTIAGQKTATFQDCRAIKEIWMTSTVSDTEGRWKLEKKDFQWLRETYPNLSDVDNGKPLYYIKAELRPAPEFHLTDVSLLSGYTKYMDVMYTSHYQYNGIIWAPPCDVQYMLETVGYWYSPTLTNDADENWWTLNHPELLVMGAQMMLEMFARNTEGVKDWKANIDSLLTQFAFDLTEEDIADVDQMEG